MSEPRVLCPQCRGPLSGAHCDHCGTSYEGPLGIIDLSPTPDLDEQTQELFARAASGTVGDLLEWRQSSFTDGRSERASRKNLHYARTAVERSERMIAMFSAAEEARSGRPLGGTVALDLGCGMGAGLVALAKRFDWVVGVDLDFPKLAFAARQIRDSNLDNVILVHGRAESLPLADGSLDAIIAVNVLEHLVDGIDHTLGEVRRTLRPGGVFCADSRNRYDLLFPEPHVQLRLVGCLPRAVQAPYVRWRTGRAYAFVRLLSPGEVRRKLTQHVGPVHMEMGRPSAWGKSSRADDVVATVGRLPVIRSVARAVYPSLIVVAERR